METKSYLKGLIYGLAFTESVSIGLLNGRLSGICNPIMVWFEDGSHLSFAVNRGICHSYGNFSAILTEEEGCSLFDIADNWLTKTQLNNLKSLGYKFDGGEIRVDFDELVEIFSSLGIICEKTTNKEWLKLYLKNYK